MKEKRNSYYYQHMVRERNRERILVLLKDNPQRFTDLEKLSKFSPRGLTGILKDLEEEKKIEKILHNKKQAYKLTQRGLRLFTGSYLLRTMIEDLEKKDSKFYDNYSTVKYSTLFLRLPWGIDDNLLVEKGIDEKHNPITTDIAASLNEELYKKIKKEIIKNKIPVDKNMKGRILLSFVIDYKELIESVEQNSLEYCKKISQQEIDLLEKMEHGTMTGKEFEEWTKIRKKKSKGKTKLR